MLACTDICLKSKSPAEPGNTGFSFADRLPGALRLEKQSIMPLCLGGFTESYCYRSGAWRGRSRAVGMQVLLRKISSLKYQKIGGYLRHPCAVYLTRDSDQVLTGSDQELPYQQINKI